MFTKCKRCNELVYIYQIYNYSSKGHLFCKECILECLLAQKKEINKRKAIITKEKEKEIVLFYIYM